MSKTNNQRIRSRKYFNLHIVYGSDCIFVLVSSRGGKLLSLKVALVTGIATKTINHTLPFIRMFRWVKLADRVENGFSDLESHTNIGGEKYHSSVSRLCQDSKQC